MSNHSDFVERIHVAGDNLVEQVEKLIHEGNVRRVIVRRHEQTVAEFPLTVGVVGALFAPALAAIGAVVAVASDCTIVVERSIEPPAPGAAGDI